MKIEISPTSPAEVARIEAEAHRMRSVEFNRMLGALKRTIVSSVRKFAGHLAALHRMHVTYSELSALNDHELRDIGLSRADIPAVAAGVYVRLPEDVPAEAPSMVTPEPAHEDLKIAA